MSIVDIRNLINDTSTTLSILTKVRNETKDEKVKLWLQRALNGMEQSVMYLLHAQKQLEDGESEETK